MYEMYETAICVFVGLAIANFICQAFTKREWGKATEISFFQAVALGTYLLIVASH